MKKLLVVLIVAAVVIFGVLMVRRAIRRSSLGNQAAGQTVQNTNPTNNQAASASLSVDDELKQLDDLMDKDNTSDLNPNDITNLQQ